MKKNTLFLLLFCGIISSSLGQNTEVILQNARQYIQDQDYLAAKEILNEVIAQNDTDPYSYFLRGFTKNQLGDYKGAIEDFSSVIALEPHNSAAYDKRGICKKDFGDPKGALADYNKAIELDPENSPAYYNRGFLKFHFLEDVQGACEDWTISSHLGFEKAAGIMKDKCIQKAGAIKTSKGLLIFYNEQDISYTLNLEGDIDLVNFPHLRIDKKFVQFNSNETEEFGQEPKKILQNYMQWEADYITKAIKEPLRPKGTFQTIQGRLVNFWNYSNRDIAVNDGEIVKTYFAGFIHKDRIYSFAYSSLEHNDSEARRFLSELLGNVKFYDAPIDPESLSKVVREGGL